jgi:hypothetical protein
VSTENFLPYRTSALVKMAWRVPENISSYPRIYAVIDAEDEIANEIQDNNNKGYNVLGSDFATNIPGSGEMVVAKTYELSQNYPNPFNPLTTIEYAIPEITEVSLVVYDVLGRVVETLVDERKSAGRHKVDFDARRLASGVYFYRLSALGITMSRRMVVVK